LFLMTWFKGSVDFENIHPLEGGFLRLKYRCDRRPGWSIEPMWRFYPRYYFEMAIKLVRWCGLYLHLRRIYLRIRRDPQRVEYTDFRGAAGFRSLFSQAPRSTSRAQSPYWCCRHGRKESYSRLQDGKGDARAA
jgi:hypothetical protein